MEEVSNSIRRLLNKNNLRGEDVDKLILHQANERIINQLIGRLGINKNNSLQNLEKYGNTSAASIPLVVAENIDLFKDKEKVILSGFGAGLSLASILMEW